MKTIRTQPNARRAPTAQGIIEGVLGALVVVMVFVFLIMLSCNGYAAISFSEKLKFVANTAAQTYANRHFFLGMLRPNFDAAAAQDNAREVIKESSARLGLPAASDVSFTDTVDGDIAYSTVTITVKDLKLPYFVAGIFPSPFKLTVVGRAAQIAMTPYATFVVDLPAGSGGSAQKHLRCAVPAYGFDVLVGSPPSSPVLMTPAPIGRRGAIVADSTIFASDGNFAGKADPLLWKIHIDENGNSSVASTVRY